MFLSLRHIKTNRFYSTKMHLIVGRPMREKDAIKANCWSTKVIVGEGKKNPNRNGHFSNFEQIEIIRFLN